MPQSRPAVNVPGYHGPDRRAQNRRAPIHPGERDWRVVNLALVGNDQRGGFGRRASDYAFLAA